MAKGKPGVVIYFETAKAIKGLDYETKGRLFEAIMNYAEDGVVPSFDGVLAAVWPFVADKIERDAQRYDSKVVQKKRASFAKWWKRYAEENGLDVNDQEAKEQWIDMRMQEDEANAYGCNAENADASFALRNMPTTTETETKTVTETKTKTRTANGNGSASAPPPVKAAKHKHGEYNNVLLTDEELDKLQGEFPHDWQQRIDNLSGYIASTGKAYKSHYATLRTWARRDKQEAKENGRVKDWCDDVRPEDYEKEAEYFRSLMNH